MGKNSSQNGFTQIPNDLFDQVAKLPCAEACVMYAIIRFTLGWQKFECETTISAIAKYIQRNISYTRKILLRLAQKGYIIISPLSRKKLRIILSYRTKSEPFILSYRTKPEEEILSYRTKSESEILSCRTTNKYINHESNKHINHERDKQINGIAASDDAAAPEELSVLLEEKRKTKTCSWCDKPETRNTDIRQLLGYYHDRFREKLGKCPVNFESKGAKVLSELLKVLDADEIEEAIHNLFSSTDPWIRQHCYPITQLQSRINELRLGPIRGDPRTEREYIRRRFE